MVLGFQYFINPISFLMEFVALDKFVKCWLEHVLRKEYFATPVLINNNTVIWCIVKQYFQTSKILTFTSSIFLVLLSDSSPVLKTVF